MNFFLATISAVKGRSPPSVSAILGLSEYQKRKFSLNENIAPPLWGGASKRSLPNFQKVLNGRPSKPNLELMTLKLEKIIDETLNDFLNFLSNNAEIISTLIDIF